MVSNWRASPLFGRPQSSSAAHASVSNTSEAGYVGRAEIFLQKVLTPGGGLHANAGSSNIDDKDGILLADQVDKSMRLNFFGGHVCGDEADKLAPVQLQGAVVRRRSLEFVSQQSIHDHRLERVDCEEDSANVA